MQMAIKYTNMTLSFLLELAALVALGYWGFYTGSGIVMQILLGLGAPLLMAVVWGLLLAPASARRLRNPRRVILELVIFGVATFALAIAGQPLLAAIIAGLVVINVGLALLWKQ